MKKLKISAIFFLIFTSFFLLTTYSHAQQTIKLTVSPPNQQINVKPGMQTRIQVKFFNASSEAVAGFIKIADFIVTNKDGSPDLIYVSPENNKYSAVSWLTPLESRINIAANTPYTATIIVNVPANVSGCGHYAAVYFEPAPAGLGAKSGSQISFKLTSLVYFIVDEKECIEKAYLNKISAPKFLEYGPIPISIEVLNRSDYHISPQGYVEVLDLTNKQVSTTTLAKYNIFPDSIRKYDLKIGSKWMFGRYKINFAAGYGKTGQALKGFAYVWVLPWRVVLIILLTLIALILILSSVYKKTVVKESLLEEEIEKEKKEIEELKKQLRKKGE